MSVPVAEPKDHKHTHVVAAIHFATGETSSVRRAVTSWGGGSERPPPEEGGCAIPVTVVVDTTVAVAEVAADAGVVPAADNNAPLWKMCFDTQIYDLYDSLLGKNI